MGVRAGAKLLVSTQVTAHVTYSGRMLSGCQRNGRLKPPSKRIPRNGLSTNPQILRCGLTPIRDELESNRLSLIETSEASALNRRDVNEHVLAAALRLDETVAFGQITLLAPPATPSLPSDRACRTPP
jgi:hypothetical protein